MRPTRARRCSRGPGSTARSASTIRRCAKHRWSGWPIHSPNISTSTRCTPSFAEAAPGRPRFFRRIAYNTRRAEVRLEECDDEGSMVVERAARGAAGRIGGCTRVRFVHTGRQPVRVRRRHTRQKRVLTQVSGHDRSCPFLWPYSFLLGIS
ncbi:hypothetical protein EMIT0111MI5_50361 [Burkholderia sp. IT-111MI5]